MLGCGGGAGGLTQAALSTFSLSTVAGLGLPQPPITAPQLPEFSSPAATAVTPAIPAVAGYGGGPPVPAPPGTRPMTASSSTWSPRLTPVSYPPGGAATAAAAVARAGAGSPALAAAAPPGLIGELPIDWQLLAGAGCRHFAAAAACSGAAAGAPGSAGDRACNVLGVLSLAARGPGRPAGWTPEVLQAAVGLLAPHLRRAQAVLTSPAAAQLHAATSVGDLVSAALATAADAAEAVAFVRGHSRLAIVHSGAAAAAIFQQQQPGSGGADADHSAGVGGSTDRGATVSGSAPRGNPSRRSFTLDFVPRKTLGGGGGGGGGSLGAGLPVAFVAAAAAAGVNRGGKPPPMSAPDHERIIIEPAIATAAARGVGWEAGTAAAAGGARAGAAAGTASLGPEWTLGGTPRAISGVPEYFNQQSTLGSPAGPSTMNSTMSRTGQSTARVLGGGATSFALTSGKAGPACKGHTLLLKGHTLLEEALARGRQDGSAGLCVEDCQAYSLNAKAIPRDLVLSRGAPMPLSLALATAAAPGCSSGTVAPTSGGGGSNNTSGSEAGAPSPAAVAAAAGAVTAPTGSIGAAPAVAAGGAATAASPPPQQQAPELALYMTYSSALPQALLRAVVQELQQLLQALLPILTSKLRGLLEPEYRLLLTQIQLAAQRKAGNSFRVVAGSGIASGSTAHVVLDYTTANGPALAANGNAMGSPFSTLFEEGHASLQDAGIAAGGGPPGASAGGAEAETYDEQGLRTMLDDGDDPGADTALAAAGAAARILNFARGGRGGGGTTGSHPRSALASGVGADGAAGTASTIAGLFQAGTGTGTGLRPGAAAGASPPGLSILAAAAASGIGDASSLEGEMDLRLVPRPASLSPHLGAGTGAGGLFGSVWGGGMGDQGLGGARALDPMNTMLLAVRGTAGGGGLGSGVGGSGVGGSALDILRPMSMGGGSGGGNGAMDPIFRRANTRPGSVGQQWQGSNLRPVSFKLEAAEAPRGASKLAPLMASLHERIRAAQTAQLAVGRSESAKADVESVRLLQEIGHGGYGTVYRGTYHGAEVAIKVIKQSRLAALTQQQQQQGAACLNTGGTSAPLLHKQNLHDAIEVVASVSMSHFNLVQVPAYFMDVRVVRQDEYAAAAGGNFPALGSGLDEGPITESDLAAAAAAATCTAAGAGASAAAGAADGAGPTESQPLRLIHAPSLLASPLPGADLSLHEGAMALVLEYCDRGSLCDAIMQKKFIERVTPKNGPPGKTYLAINMRSVYATLLEVALALRHMHSLHLVHCDLKPQNVLLKSSPRDPRGFTAKLSDFGLSKMLAADEDTGQLVIDDTVASGTITHVAPEVLLGQKTLTAAVDIYSFGILMQQMLCGMRVYNKTNATDIANAVAHKGMRPALPHWVPSSYRALASACWHHSPANRPTAEQLVARLERAIETKQHRSGSSSSATSKAAAASSRAPSGVAAGGGLPPTAGAAAPAPDAV
ncbi:hypothetical protein HXX76_015911 [Chlamydomonas incerta]|uniref:Protein kinase domain-containing protein n=1 Tax=Chlamydomonas incerta TaxID=51695 RepID=A0A835SFR1_CHLIN|nr:hypothetical protein HXX76_015911 [Chlamydomonas incerta]|eukprot:KAG2422583.1 hypothetical protein HXX76_015911 [Chlamydomonas incerta]